MHTRKQNRLPDNKIYQASNAYFITITTKNRLSIFGHVVPIIAGVGEKFISPAISHVVSPAIPNVIPPIPIDSTNATQQSSYNSTPISQSPNNHTTQPSHYNTAGEINFSPTPAMDHDGAEMIHSWVGEIVQNAWLDLPNQFSNIVLDEFVVMPNHFHGIITFFGKPVFICSGKESDLSKVIKHFKSSSTLQIKNQQTAILLSDEDLASACTHSIQCLFENYSTIWHKSYYDKVIRNEKSLSTIQQYIRDNPMKWHLNRQKLIK
ncbi:MAG: hypothetical protein WCK98_05475 [bacterium]